MTILPDPIRLFRRYIFIGFVISGLGRAAFGAATNTAASDTECIANGLAAAAYDRCRSVLSPHAHRAAHRRGIHALFGRLRHGHEAKPGSHKAQPRRDYLLPRFSNGQGKAAGHFQSRWFSI
jgi:hypothetical protein